MLVQSIDTYINSFQVKQKLRMDEWLGGTRVSAYLGITETDVADLWKVDLSYGHKSQATKFYYKAPSLFIVLHFKHSL